MEIIIDVDTNDYNEDEVPYWHPNYAPPWSLFRLKVATFREWKSCGQTNFWTIDGETFCGTCYRCEVNFSNDLLLRCLVAKIKEVCGNRFKQMRIDGEVIKFTDDNLMCMPPELVKKMKETRRAVVKPLSNQKKYTINQWLEIFGVEVIDWDGFGNYELTDEIDLSTFITELNECTIRPTNLERYKVLNCIA